MVKNNLIAVESAILIQLKRHDDTGSLFHFDQHIK